MSWKREVAAFLREQINDWVRKGGSVTALAKKVGVTSQQLSQIRSQSRGAGMDTIDGFAHLMGISSDELRTRAHEWYQQNAHEVPAERVEYDAPVRPTFGNHPGWREAEDVARARHPYLPDEAWLGARELSGMQTPEIITAEFVYDVATLWLKHRRRSPPPTPEQREAERAEDERLERLHDELAEKRRRK